MSYILDALRRAERERHLGEAPSVAEITQATDATSAWPRRPLVLAAASVGAIAVAALVYGLWPQPPSRPASVSAAPASKARVVPTPVPLSKSTARTETPHAAIAPTETTAAADSANRLEPAPPPALPAENITSLDDLTAPPKMPVTAGPVTAGPVQRETSPQIQPFDAAKTAPNPNPASAPAPSNPPVGSAPAGPAPAPPTASASPPASTPPPAAVTPGVTNLRDMPASFRADFPPINVDVHFWDENPQRRFVLINMRRYKQGERTAEGLAVVEIVPDGIVFDYRGQRVLYAMTR